MEVDPEIKRIMDETGGDEQKLLAAMRDYTSKAPKERQVRHRLHQCSLT